MDVDPAQLAADADVLATLRRHGDVPTIPRTVDARFVGMGPQIAALARAAPRLGWKIVALQEDDRAQGFAYVTLARFQTVEPHAVRRLTEDSLRLAKKFLVRYDGWGCVAQRRPK